LTGAGAFGDGGSSMAKIVLATIGSLGDLHPFIAIGKALVAQGERVVLAVPEDGLAKARGAGLDAVSIFPDFASVCADLGLRQDEVAAKVIAEPDFVVDRLLMPYLGSSVAALDTAADGADVIAGSIFCFAAAIVADKRDLPLAAIVLQPMTLFSTWAPPVAPRFGIMRHRPATMLGRGWNRLVYALARGVLRRRYASRIDAVRAEHGLAPSIGMPLLDYGATAAATLCCWSPEFSPLPPDAPARAILTGFPFFDSETGATEPLAAELEAFLTAGPPPLVFTLGSVAVASAGHFYEEAAAISRALGRRAVMLTGNSSPVRTDGDCLFIDYAPHSQVFPRAEAVVHHGGIGTTGQALRAGRSQIIVPHFGDQFDNAARLERSGLAAIVSRHEFRADVATRIVGKCLADSTIAGRARQVAASIARQDPAAIAANCLSALSKGPT
jgi:rhamnosyltransferase subunit B